MCFSLLTPILSPSLSFYDKGIHLTVYVHTKRESDVG